MLIALADISVTSCCNSSALSLSNGQADLQKELAVGRVVNAAISDGWKKTLPQ